MDDLSRLDRIENKIDKLAEVIASVARLEERLDAVDKRVSRHEYRLDDQEQHTEALNTKVGETTQSRTFLERFIWVLISGAVAAITYVFKES